MALNGMKNVFMEREESIVGNPNQPNKSNQKEKQLKKTIARFGEIRHLSEDLVNNLDYSNKKFINRIYESEIDLKGEEFQELKDSIKSVGLINIIYLQENEQGKKIIVSGLRRLLAVKELYNEGERVSGKDRVVVFRNDTPYDLLDSISIDENTRRKNLRTVELAYKMQREADENKMSIEKIAEKYGFSKRHAQRIKNSLNFPFEVKVLIDEIGITRAEELNKLVKLLKNKESINFTVDKYKDFSKRELIAEYQRLKKQKNSENKVELKKSTTQITFKVKGKISKELVSEFERFKKEIENRYFK